MSEFYPGNPESAAEFERRQALDTIIEHYMSDQKEFLSDFDEDDKISAVYGMLLELGEDPVMVLTEAGVLEKEGDDDEV